MQALEKYNIEKDIAAYIKKEFDRKYNATWHCIVGRNFGATRHDNLIRLVVRLLAGGGPAGSRARPGPVDALGPASNLRVPCRLVRDARDQALHLLLPRYVQTGAECARSRYALRDCLPNQGKAWRPGAASRRHQR